MRPISIMRIAREKWHLYPHRTYNHIWRSKCELPVRNLHWSRTSLRTRLPWELLNWNYMWIRMTHDNTCYKYQMRIALNKVLLNLHHQEYSTSLSKHESMFMSFLILCVFLHCLSQWMNFPLLSRFYSRQFIVDILLILLNIQLYYELAYVLLWKLSVKW